MRKSGKDYLEAFGELGGVYFAQGKTWDEATTLYIASLESRKAELERQLAARRPYCNGAESEVVAAGFNG